MKEMGMMGWLDGWVSWIGKVKELKVAMHIKFHVCGNNENELVEDERHDEIG